MCGRTSLAIKQSGFIKMAVKDTDNTKKILERFKQISDKELSIGIQGKEAEAYHTDPETGERTARMIVIAGANEFGARVGRGRKIKIPERSFIRGTFDANQDDIIEESAKQLERVIEGEVSANAVLSALGERYESLTKEFLTELSDPPNSQYTIDKKGSSNPLIDTGRLRQAITHKVGKRDAQNKV